MQWFRMQQESVAKWRRLKMYVSTYWDRQRSLLVITPILYTRAEHFVLIYTAIHTPMGTCMQYKHVQTHKQTIKCHIL